MKKRKSQSLLIKNRFSDILVFLFVFFLPTQLGKHFFLPFSYISGVRVDYLAPTVYVTDIFAFLLILTHLHEYRNMLKNKTVQLILFLLSITLIFAVSRDFGLYKFLKMIELFAVAAIFASPQINKKYVFYAFFAATVLQCYIAFFQLIFKHSLNGDFYFLGERPLNLSRPGIAKAALDGVEMLRPYGTFSHPNSLAGFFAVLYGYYLFNKADVNKFLYWSFIVLSATLVVISFSKVAIGVFFLTTLWYLVQQKKLGRNGSLRAVVITFIAFVCALFFKASTDPLTIEKRLTLTFDSLSIIKQNLLTGVGLGDYLYAQARFPQNYPSFIMQPVHNIFLLIIAELGLPISLYIFYVLAKHIRPFISHTPYLIPLVAIFITGMFDHYWLTLQQNWLLMGVIWGLIHVTASPEVSRRSRGSDPKIS